MDETGKITLAQQSAGRLRSPKYVELLGVGDAPGEVRAAVWKTDPLGKRVTLVEGRQLSDVSYDAATKRLRITLPPESRNATTELTFTR